MCEKGALSKGRQNVGVQLQLQVGVEWSTYTNRKTKTDVKLLLYKTTAPSSGKNTRHGLRQR
jgi:hypothetical protein